MPAFRRDELEEMMRRWVAANDRAGETGDWGPMARLLRRGRASTAGTTARSTSSSRAGATRSAASCSAPRWPASRSGPTPTCASLIDEQIGEVIGIWRQIAPVKKADGTPYEIAGTGGSWFRYGGNFQWSWQRDFFDHANAGDHLHRDGEGRQALRRACSAAWRRARRCRAGCGSPSSTGTRRSRRRASRCSRCASTCALPRAARPPAELYRAALEMAEWGEANGCLAVQVSEHHVSPDGYLPAPLVLAAAIAGRTRRASDPGGGADPSAPRPDRARGADGGARPRSPGGRVSYVLAVGYREQEYAACGRDFAARGRRMDACLEALQRALPGEPFEFEGRPVRVLPRPATPGGPPLLLGGGSAAAVRRAARFGLGMVTQGGERVARRALPRRVRAARPRAGRLHRSRRRHRHLGLRRRGRRTRAWAAPRSRTCCTTRRCTRRGWARAAPRRSRARRASPSCAPSRARTASSRPRRPSRTCAAAACC